MVVGIDPSFSSTGISVCDIKEGELKVVYLSKCKSGRSVYKQLSETHAAAQSIVNQIDQVVQTVPNSCVIVEQPASSTISGSYLNILNGYIAHYLNNCGLVRSVCWIPPTAYQHLIGHRIENKSEIVTYCRDRGWISAKRVSQDACNALIFCEIWRLITKGEWDASYTMSELVNGTFKDTSKVTYYLSK